MHEDSQPFTKLKELQSHSTNQTHNCSTFNFAPTHPSPPTTLNKEYYQQLLQRFEPSNSVFDNFSNNSSRLTTKIINENLTKNKPIHINFQGEKAKLEEVAKNLYIELSNNIYLNHYDLPKRFLVGDRLKKNRDKQYYIVISENKSVYTLRQDLRKQKTEISPAIISGVSYDNIAKNYVPVDSGVSDKTMKSYFDFFEKLNSEKSDFPRINFEQKIVFISKKTLWDGILEKSKIPSIYLPNPRDEEHKSEIRTIQALSSCIAYFTPKYDVCYQQLLQKGEKIKTIVVFDTELEKLQQILQDKQKYKFNLIVLTNSFEPNKSEIIPLWNWYKEELELIDKL